MKVYSSLSFAKAYKDSLSDLLLNPEYETRPRGLGIKENIGVALHIENPLSNMYINTKRSSQYRYIAGELMWYFLGRNDVKYISNFSKFWEKIQNDDGTANSAYGNLIFKMPNEHDTTQYDWVLTSLIKDRDSRQAIMHFNRTQHQFFGNRDFVCTMYANFHIRRDKLNLRVYMRSNDAIIGTPTDVAFFTVLQQQALLHLRDVYPELELGSYTHIADSYHIYEKHYDLVKDMLDYDFIPVQFPTMKTNFVTTEGAPTKDLIKLSENLHSLDPVVSDVAYLWIQNNVKKQQ